MSKPEQERITVLYDDYPILKDLGLTELLKEFRRLHMEQIAHETKAKEYMEKKRPFGDAVKTAIEEIHADAVIASIDGKAWRASLVGGDPDATKTNEDKLRENMMKLGKLDAATVKKIFDRSQDPTPRKAYVRVTVGD